MYGSITRTEVSHNEIKGSLVLSTVVSHVHVLLFPAMTIQTCDPKCVINHVSPSSFHYSGTNLAFLNLTECLSPSSSYPFFKHDKA